MAKMRVHELAKELEIKSQEIIDSLSGTEYEIKSASNNIDDAAQEIIRKKYKKSASKAEEKPAAEKVEKPAAPKAEEKARPEEKKPADADFLYFLRMISCAASSMLLLADLISYSVPLKLSIISCDFISNSFASS